MVVFFGKQITIVASAEYVETIRFSIDGDENKINAVTSKVAIWLKEYENGNFIDFDFNLIKEIKKPESKLENVYVALIKTKTGETITYKQLATLANVDNATRFVGTCMAKNNLPIIIPCHRVLKSDLSLGQYSFEGPAFKALLLEHEKRNKYTKGEIWEKY